MLAACGGSSTPASSGNGAYIPPKTTTTQRPKQTKVQVTTPSKIPPSEWWSDLPLPYYKTAPGFNVSGLNQMQTDAMDWIIADQSGGSEQPTFVHGLFYQGADALQYSTPAYQQQMIANLKLDKTLGAYSGAGTSKNQIQFVLTIDSVITPTNAPLTATTGYVRVQFSSTIFGTKYPQAGEYLGVSTRTLAMQKINGVWLVSRYYDTAFN